MDISPVTQAEAASEYKGDVSKIGASLCFFVPLSLICSSALVSLFSSLTGFEGQDLLLKMQGGALYIIYTLISSVLPLLFCITFLLKLQKQHFSVFSLKPSVSAGGFLYYVALGLLSIPASAIVANITQNILHGFNIKTTTLSAPKGDTETVFFIIIFSVLVPILEEILFRFAILERLRIYGDVAAIVVSAMLFSFAHSSFQSFPHAFVMGLVLGFVGVKTKSALAPIIIHAINNLLSTISLVITASDYSEAKIALLGFIIIGLLITALIVVIFLRNEHGITGLEFNGKEIKTSRKASLIFTNFWVILFLIISVGYAFFIISI